MLHDSTIKTELKFWILSGIKDNFSECWLWSGDLTKDGYGKLGSKKAHRIMWAKCFKQPIGNLSVLHKCDNPKCVNPSHLFLGTQIDNIKDMVSKDRQWRPIGEKNVKAKLNWNKVREIRQKYKDGISAKQLSVEYGVWISTIFKIKNNECWKE